MKKFFMLLFLLSSVSIYSQEEQPELKQYFFVMLKKGPNRSQDSQQANKIQEGHMQNIIHLSEIGKLVCAGPFGDDEGGGILILNVKTFEEAKEIVEKDPAVISGRLIFEIRPWWTDKRTFSLELEED